MKIDLNCDLGEEAGNDEAIMPYITSANIACGFHAGNENVMRDYGEACQTIWREHRGAPGLE